MSERRSHIVRPSALTVPTTPSIPAWMSPADVQAELDIINGRLRIAAIQSELDQVNADLAALDAAAEADTAPALEAAAAALGAGAVDDEPVPLRRAEPNSARFEG